MTTLDHPSASGARTQHQETRLRRRDSRLLALGPSLRRLEHDAVDFDDPRAEQRYYGEGAKLVEGVIDARATTLEELRVKAEAVRWCYGGDLALPPEATLAERVIQSLIEDLLAFPEA